MAEYVSEGRLPWFSSFLFFRASSEFSFTGHEALLDRYTQSHALRAWTADQWEAEYRIVNG